MPIYINFEEEVLIIIVMNTYYSESQHKFVDEVTIANKQSIKNTSSLEVE